MPPAIPLGPDRYVQYLRTDPQAPRQEPARTHEIKGKKRHGEGVAYRLFGPHALVLGRWTGQAMTDFEKSHQQVTEEGDRTNGWGRLIHADEVDHLAATFRITKAREGWVAPPWHWRFYWDRVVVRLVPTHLIHYTTYGMTAVQPVEALKYWVRVLCTAARLKMGLRVPDGRSWRPLRLVEDDPEDAEEVG